MSGGCWKPPKVLGLGVDWKEENSPKPGETKEEDGKSVHAIATEDFTRASSGGLQFFCPRRKSSIKISLKTACKKRVIH